MQLSAEQEQGLVDWLVAMSKIGYGLTQKEIPDIVKSVHDEVVKVGYIFSADTSFIGNRPSKN